MLLLRRLIVLLLAATGLARAQPALTTIQDILYRADGTRFSGTIFWLNWSSFWRAIPRISPRRDLTLPIVNGVLNVRLAPTTTASARRAI